MRCNMAITEFYWSLGRKIRKIKRSHLLMYVASCGIVVFLVGCLILTRHANCAQVKIQLSSTKLPLTALASFPGSGNTWLRHLVQQATGIGTGSIYCDWTLRDLSFPFECVRNESVIMVKTHERLNSRDLTFKRVVLQIRNPFDAFRAEFNRRYSSGIKHTGFAPESSLKYWPGFAEKAASFWRRRLLDWLNFEGPIHVIKYEDLENNMQHELRKLFEFLNISVSESAISCAVAKSEGHFHRARQDSILKYDDRLTGVINREIQLVSQQLPLGYL